MRILLAVWALAFAIVVPVQAHRLTLEWEFSGGILRIRGLLGREPAAGADVELRDASGDLMTEGTLDEAGRFRWPLSGADSVTIDVNAGLGHRRTLVLSEADMQPGLVDAPETAWPADSSGSTAFRTSGSSDAAFASVVRVGLGLTFLLALAAAWMSYRNTQRLANLERRLERHESRG